MPISSGALDWPVSYYVKPANQDVYNNNLDNWSHSNAYQNWTWKTKRGRKKKKPSPESQVERLRHRRRCCCCVVWWTVCFLLVLLTLTLFMVFWIRNRAHDLPPVLPWELEKDYPSCKGHWGEDFVVYQDKINASFTLNKCCYGRNLKKAGSTIDAFINKDCTGGTKDSCAAAYPNDPICGGTSQHAHGTLLLVMVLASTSAYYVEYHLL